jgi:hypothetical protein
MSRNTKKKIVMKPRGVLLVFPRNWYATFTSSACADCSATPLTLPCSATGVLVQKAPIAPGLAATDR